MASSLPKPSANLCLPMVSGYSIPQIGFGVYQTQGSSASHGAETPSTCYNILRTALSAGYRHVDTAAAYRNEKDCALAFSHYLKEKGIKREELFYTTKLAPKITGYEETKKAIEESLQNIGGGSEGGDGLGYIDLYLIHAPTGNTETRRGSWRAMVEAQKRGEIKSLGVSNYGVHHLDELEGYIKEEEEKGVKEGKGEGWGGKISVWQGEIHPWLSRKDIREWCAKRGVIVEAYCPLVRGRRMKDPLITPLVEKYNKTPAQILVRWSLQMGFVPLPKTETPKRVTENFDVFDFELTQEEVEKLDTGKYEPIAWDPTVWGLNHSG